MRVLFFVSACNVMFQEVDDIYTIRNYGRRSNCSLSTVFPAIVKIVAIDVGVTPSAGRGLELETGTIHKVRFQVLHAKSQCALALLTKRKGLKDSSIS